MDTFHFFFQKDKKLNNSKIQYEVLVAQTCLTLCNPMDCSPPDSSVHGILQARILEWVAIPFSREFPDPGIKSGSPVLQADSLSSESPGDVNNIIAIDFDYQFLYSHIKNQI